jgi:hypothetical protein
MSNKDNDFDLVSDIVPNMFPNNSSGVISACSVGNSVLVANAFLFFKSVSRI